MIQCMWLFLIVWRHIQIIIKPWFCDAWPTGQGVARLPGSGCQCTWIVQPWLPPQPWPPAGAASTWMPPSRLLWSKGDRQLGHTACQSDSEVRPVYLNRSTVTVTAATAVAARRFNLNAGCYGLKNTDNWVTQPASPARRRPGPLRAAPACFSMPSRIVLSFDHINSWRFESSLLYFCSLIAELWLWFKSPYKLDSLHLLRRGFNGRRPHLCLRLQLYRGEL